MIRAKLNSGLIILGIDAENVRRLKRGLPIVVDLTDLGGEGEVMIVYGETLEDIRNDLERAMGVPFPEPQTIDDLKRKAH